MEDLYATIGRKQTELDSLNREYDRLLQILEYVRTGAILPENLTVDLIARTWGAKVPPTESEQPTNPPGEVVAPAPAE